MIVGSSLISRLAKFVRDERRVWQLPIPVELFGKPGLRLSELRTLLDVWIRDVTPVVLVVHAGANDIGALNTLEWFRELEVVVLYLRARWPATRLVWSDMLPRTSWRFCTSRTGAENSRRRSQRRARYLFFQEGGAVIRHPSIRGTPTHLATDGVHLNRAGQINFLRSLEGGLLGIVGNLTC